MPDERREFHKIRPASHTLLSVNCLYQMNMEKRKWVFTKLRRRMGMSSVFPSLHRKLESRGAAREYSPRRKPRVIPKAA